MTLKDLVAGNNIVKFKRYFDAQLWYQVHTWSPSEDDGWGPIGPEFPVPISDIGTATFLATDKAVLFMRYIRKHLELLEQAMAEPGSS